MRSHAQREGNALQVPAELRRSIPRSVILTRAGVAVWLCAFALAGATIAAALGLTIKAGRDAQRADELRQDTATAVVEQAGRARGNSGRPFIVYRYAVDGVRYQGRANISRDGAARLPVGATLEVRHLSSNPRVSWLPGRESKGVPFWLAPIIALAIAPWGPLIVLRLGRQRRLLEEGRPAIARVVGSKKQQGPHGIQFQRVRYEFSTLSGSRRTGHFDAQKSPPALGSAILVLYDPDEPKRHARYPLSHYRVEPVPA